jgi:type I restriction-modification system DNA methylase subunit
MNEGIPDDTGTRQVNQMRNDRLTQEFEYGLTQLDMMVPDKPESSGLVFVDRLPSDVEPHEYIALEKARKYEADAVYFRRFGEGRASIPQIYIYDFTRSEKDEDEIGELHRRLWNSGQVPLFFIFTRTEVKIFNCLRKPELDDKSEKVIYSPMETINLTARVDEELEKLKEFSARKFDNGTFWEVSSYKDDFNLNEGSYETLLDHLKKIRDNLIHQNILEKTILQKLLVMSILVKYLEERRDEKGNTVFPEGFFSRYADGAKEFTGILKTKGACLKLFDYLSRHFNGEIFKWDNENERDKLFQADLTPFAKFLKAREDSSGQGTLWRLYSFNDLPIELISNIYEEFLGDKEGVVYTPPYLVHFLIDEAMPLAVPRPNFKVLDPACGSGVFLVAAYQRIINWWRIQNNWGTPGLNTLKRLLKENIYGVDVEEEAVRLATFSLSLALLDELSPRVIWEELKFDNLKNINLFEKDFFELIAHREFDETFDLVIGNPPFIEKLTTIYAKQIEQEEKGKRIQLPGNQLALLFLDQSLNVCKPRGMVCLILPAGPFLYNNNSFEFRKHLLQTYNVKQILDFTALSEVLFGSVDVATLSVFVKKEKPALKNILHVTFRRTKASKEKIHFELDHYDFHQVSYGSALNEPLIWKSNLLGGGRLHYIASRFS